MCYFYWCSVVIGYDLFCLFVDDSVNWFIDYFVIIGFCVNFIFGCFGGVMFWYGM